MAGKGGKRDGAGRKSKAEEQRLIEKLTPLEPLAFEALEMALVNPKSHNWSVPLFFNYMYGKPNQKIDVKTDNVQVVKYENVSKQFPDA